MRIIGFPVPLTTVEKLMFWQTAICAAAAARRVTLSASFMQAK
jgi:hypothetical protein